MAFMTVLGGRKGGKPRKADVWRRAAADLELRGRVTVQRSWSGGSLRESTSRGMGRDEGGAGPRSGFRG